MTPVPGLAGADGRRFTVDGLRAEVTTAGVAFSSDRFGRLLAAVDLSGTWVSATDDGLVTASDGFLGDLRRVGQVPRPVTVADARGRLALIAGDSLWVTDGRALTRAEGLPTRTLSATFADARFGAASLVPGGLVVTADGEASWSPIDLGSDAALAVSLDPDGLRVATCWCRRTARCVPHVRVPSKRPVTIHQ